MTTLQTLTQDDEILDLITEPCTVEFTGRLAADSASSCSGGDEVCNSDCSSGDGSDAC
jgi:hypothetical protein